jgi:hypothetical protein
MFEMAKDEIVESQTYEIMAGYYSPVYAQPPKNKSVSLTSFLCMIRSSYYKKAGLAPAHHRVRMCELAVEHTSTWLMVDPWEAGQPEYQRTAVVLDHFDEMLNGKDGESGVEMRNGSRRKYKVMLLAGGDLIESFGEPGVWSAPDVSQGCGTTRMIYMLMTISAAYHSREIRVSDRGKSRFGCVGIPAIARHFIPSPVSTTHFETCRLA